MNQSLITQIQKCALIGIVALLCGCNTYKEYIANDDACNWDDDIFILREDEKRIDFKDNEKEIDSLSKLGKEFLLIDNENIKSTIKKNIRSKTFLNKQTNKRR